jgi:hypothetical protein
LVIKGPNKRFIKYRGNSLFCCASAYLPYDSDEPPPTKEVRDITEHCQSRKKQLIVGCDANAHRILWGSTGTNPRGYPNGISGELEPEYSQPW